MQIKYRGKSLSTGEWVYGWYIREARGLINGLPAINLSQAEIVSYIVFSADGELQIHEVDPKTVGQYIGRKDKKEREIYSDDIYIIRSYLGDDEEDYDTKYLVAYEDFSDCCVNGVGYSFGKRGSPADIEQIEVIGNLTDNPDLLTQ